MADGVYDQLAETIDGDPGVIRLGGFAVLHQLAHIGDLRAAAGKGLALRPDEQLGAAIWGDEHAGGLKERPVVGEVANVGEVGFVRVDNQRVETGFGGETGSAFETSVEFLVGDTDCVCHINDYILRLLRLLASFFRYMARNRVTLADLARDLSLSTCTVSKILNRSFNGFTYSQETIRRVEECAQRMGYTANTQARSLRTRRTMLIGFVLPSAQVALFGALTDALEMALRAKGYQVLIVHSRNDSAAEPELISALMARGIDGLVWLPATEAIAMERAGLRDDFPAVILDRPFCTDRIPFVATANTDAACEVARRAYALGHRRVAILNAPEGDRSLRERFDGFREVFGEGIVCAELPNEVAAAKAAIPGLLRAGADGERPSLLVALSESLAIGAIAGVRDLGLNFSGELSFIAFDDFPLAEHWTPRITVVRQDVERLVRETVRLLLARIKSPTAKGGDIRVEASVEWRESVLPFPG